MATTAIMHRLWQILLLFSFSCCAFVPQQQQLAFHHHAVNDNDNPFVRTVVASFATPPKNNNYDDADGSTTTSSVVKEEKEEYRNAVTQFLSQFLPSNKSKNTEAAVAVAADPTSSYDDKIPKLPLETLAELLDAELLEKEWFVTGNVNASYFSDDFSFQDPDVKVQGIQEYARGVARLFDPASRAEIISTVAFPSNNTITVTWRLSGKVNVGPAGLVIKPYICYTDFTVDETSGLIRFQEDRFDIPGWDILLSALFPFLIGIVTSPPAPPVPPRRP